MELFYTHECGNPDSDQCTLDLCVHWHPSGNIIWLCSGCVQPFWVRTTSWSTPLWIRSFRHWVASWFRHIAFPRTMASIEIQQWLKNQRGFKMTVWVFVSIRRSPQSSQELVHVSISPGWRLGHFQRIGLNITFPHIRCDEVDGSCLLVVAGVNVWLETEGCYFNSKRSTILDTAIAMWCNDVLCRLLMKLAPEMGECGEPWIQGVCAFNRVCDHQNKSRWRLWLPASCHLKFKNQTAQRGTPDKNMFIWDVLWVLGCTFFGSKIGNPL